VSITITNLSLTLLSSLSFFSPSTKSSETVAAKSFFSCVSRPKRAFSLGLIALFSKKDCEESALILLE